MQKSNIDTFPGTRVLLSENGEMVLALPIFAEGVDSGEDTKMTINVSDRGIDLEYLGHVGYIIYHPEFGEMVFNTQIHDLFEDLGKLS